MTMSKNEDAVSDTLDTHSGSGARHIDRRTGYALFPESRCGGCA